MRALCWREQIRSRGWPSCARIASVGTAKLISSLTPTLLIPTLLRNASWRASLGRARSQPNDAVTVSRMIATTTGDSYESVIGWGAIATLAERLKRLNAPRRVHLITDSVVAPLYLETLELTLAQAGFDPQKRAPYLLARLTRHSINGAPSSTGSLSDTLNAVSFSSRSVAAWSATWPGSQPQPICAASR